MCRRVGAAISCAVWLLLACGKSERGTPRANDSAGESTAGVASASSGTGNSADGEASGGEASGGSAASCSGSYRACGCGCCVGQVSPLTCVYPERGDDLAKLIAADIASKSDLRACSAAGCSVGEDYVCCESPPLSAEQASYLAERLIGGDERIVISKRASNCSWFTLRERGPSPPGRKTFAVETPAFWQFDRGATATCDASVPPPFAIGALGTVSLRELDNLCVADVHLALFFGTDAHTVDAERFDVDALSTDVPLASCH
jgi:hypothetical protein